MHKFLKVFKLKAINRYAHPILILEHFYLFEPIKIFNLYECHYHSY